MSAEFIRPAEVTREIWPGITQEIRSPIVETKLPGFNIQVALAKNRLDLTSIYRRILPDGHRDIVSDVDLGDGRFLVVHAPPEVTVVRTLSEAKKNSKKSDAVYPVEFKTPKLWVLVQYLDGQATRHSHPQAIEAFTLLDAAEYGIHDETSDQTEINTVNGMPKFVNIRDSNSDHQCFSFENPSLALIVLVGESIEHKPLPALSKKHLLEKAARSRIAASEA